MTSIDASALAQLDKVIALYQGLRQRSAQDDLSDLQRGEYMGFIAAARAAVERISGRGSAYVRQAESVLERFGAAHPVNAANLAGIVKALREDVDAGYMRNLQELVRGDLFADFLEMVDHLVETGYKDAAAVISGSALESHLRQLAAKHGVPVTTEVNGEERPKERGSHKRRPWLGAGVRKAGTKERDRMAGPSQQSGTRRIRRLFQRPSWATHRIDPRLHRSISRLRSGSAHLPRRSSRRWALLGKSPSVERRDL